MGCLSQRYQKELEEAIPEVDRFYGKFNFKQLLSDLGKAEIPSCDGSRSLTTPHHYAYIKIAEGVIVNVRTVPYHLLLVNIVRAQLMIFLMKLVCWQLMGLKSFKL